MKPKLPLLLSPAQRKLFIGTVFLYALIANLKTEPDPAELATEYYTCQCVTGKMTDCTFAERWYPSLAHLIVWGRT